MPRSPWLASPGCRKNAGLPVLARVAAILCADVAGFAHAGDDDAAGQRQAEAAGARRMLGPAGRAATASAAASMSNVRRARLQQALLRWWRCVPAAFIIGSRAGMIAPRPSAVGSPWPKDQRSTMDPQQVAELIRHGAAAARRSRCGRTTTPISRRGWSAPAFEGTAAAGAPSAGLPRARRARGTRDPCALDRSVHAAGVGDARASPGQRRSVDKLQITGGIPLEGEVRISGAKNATLPILAGGAAGRRAGDDRQRAAPAGCHHHHRTARPHGRHRDHR